MKNFKGVYSKIIHAKLSYSPNQCPHCHGKDIIKWGSKTSNIRFLKILEYNSILRLQKQRFRCKDCGKTFSAETDIVDKNCCISNEIMKTSLKTFKKHLEYIENSLTYDYNNGLIEGINRKIKTIKRTAYGYKSFYHFRAKILISNNLLATK